MRVFSDHGFAKSKTITVAAEADMAPSILHHYFDTKEDMLLAAASTLAARLSSRFSDFVENERSLEDYVTAALRTGPRADTRSARAWVSLFAQGVANPAIARWLRSFVQKQLELIQNLEPRFSKHDAAAVLAYVIGCLVVGAFAPSTVAGFADARGRLFVTALRSK